MSKVLGEKKITWNKAIINKKLLSDTYFVALNLNIEVFQLNPGSNTILSIKSLHRAC